MAHNGGESAERGRTGRNAFYMRPVSRQAEFNGLGANEEFSFGQSPRVRENSDGSSARSRDRESRW